LKTKTFGLEILLNKEKKTEESQTATIYGECTINSICIAGQKI
jgi:hypothetical protein